MMRELSPPSPFTLFPLAPLLGVPRTPAVAAAAVAIGARQGPSNHMAALGSARSDLIILLLKRQQHASYLPQRCGRRVDLLLKAPVFQIQQHPVVKKCTRESLFF